MFFLQILYPCTCNQVSRFLFEIQFLVFYHVKLIYTFEQEMHILLANTHSWRRTVNLSETSSLLSCSCSATLLAYSTLQLNPVFYSNPLILPTTFWFTVLFRTILTSERYSSFQPPLSRLSISLLFLSTFLSPSRTLHMVYHKPLPRYY